MPTTRKKVSKTVYKEASSDEEKGRDFSDSGSDAKISHESSSEDDEVELAHSSGDEFDQKSKNLKSLKRNRKHPQKKTTFAKDIIKKISKQTSLLEESDNTVMPAALFSIKDLSEADKLLPSILNLSESDSSDDESPKSVNKHNTTIQQYSEQQADSDNECITEYKDVWSNNMQTHDNGEEIAKKTFMELEQHKSIVEEAKASVQNYTMKLKEQESDVKDLLALGEEVLPVLKVGTISKKPKIKSRRDDSDSEMEDWEEVKETKAVPQQGIQLFVEFPDAAHRKTKKIDFEMMMKRKINRVKKEYQVYMHKVHILCWLGHGNYINRVLNDQELMAAALSLVPSKECYPSDRVDMKYVEQITSWYKDKLTLKQDKNEDKFKPNAPPLKTILLDLIKKRIVTTKKYLAFIFVAMLRALGLQCRVMFNFVVLPIKPPSSELCSLSTKPNDEQANIELKPESCNTKNKSGADKKKGQTEPKASNSKTNKQKLAQVDGNYDSSSDNDNMEIDWSYDYVNKDAYENIMQVDGGDDSITTKRTRSTKIATTDTSGNLEEEDVSPPKIVKRSARASPKPNTKLNQKVDVTKEKANSETDTNKKSTSDDNSKCNGNVKEHGKVGQKSNNVKEKAKNSKSTNKNATDASADIRTQNNSTKLTNSASKDKCNIPKIIISDENKESIASKYFENTKTEKPNLSRKRSSTANPTSTKNTTEVEEKRTVKVKERTKSAPGAAIERSKYFANDKAKQNTPKQPRRKEKNQSKDEQRVSHRDLARSSSKGKADITGDLVDIIKSRIKEAKSEARKGIVKGKINRESDEDSDYLPVENLKHSNSGSDDDFKPTKISPKPSTSRCIDRRILSSSSSTSSERAKKNKIDVWCEIFVEELEQWIPVDIIKGNIYSTKDIYASATHPVCYVVGWDNNNYLKDLTRKYVPRFNTDTRKLRVEPLWWDEAVRPYLGPNTPRNREEDEYLDKMQLEAPLPKSIGEYKNHPLYALKRHLLKFEAIYPPDAAVLGFVRSEAVYARECVYTCRSRDTWLKEAKVVRLAELPYKVVKARPKWDKLSNKLITDKPLEVYGPWQVQDYEPPVAENGVVPRNAYGNVELFKDCMLPKGTVHIKLPGLNRVAKKLDIDCAPAMTGFDFNGGWSHPVYDGFVVCKEFEEIITEAWVKDQEEQERKELEKIELRVYGNWKRLIKGLLIRERLKNKYGFDDPKTSAPAKGKSKGPKLVVKKKS